MAIRSVRPMSGRSRPVAGPATLFLAWGRTAVVGRWRVRSGGLDARPLGGGDRPGLRGHGDLVWPGGQGPSPAPLEGGVRPCAAVRRTWPGAEALSAPGGRRRLGSARLALVPDRRRSGGRRSSPRSITPSLGRGGPGPSQPGGPGAPTGPSGLPRFAHAGRFPAVAGLGPALLPRPPRTRDRGEGRGPPGLLPAGDGERPC